MRFALFAGVALILFSCRLKEKERIKISFPEGGVDYPAQIAPGGEQFFMYPWKDSFSYRDSVFIAYYAPLFYKPFKEPNFSLQPPKENTFRFTFDGAFWGYAAVITFTQDRIRVKQVKTRYPYGYHDDYLLDSLEREHYGLLTFYTMLHEYQGTDRGMKYRDSVNKVHPQLNDRAYFFHLLKKSTTEPQGRFRYTEWIKALSREKYLYFIDKLNTSEFWRAKPDAECTQTSTDGYSCTMEAATLNRYHGVNFTDCGELALLNAFCNELMLYSGMSERGEKWYKEKVQQYKQQNERQ